MIAKDRKGNPINIDSLIVVKGSKIVRSLISDQRCYDGMIHVQRVDGNSIGLWKWVNPSNCEVVGVKA